jgi:hypothetical protein
MKNKLNSIRNEGYSTINKFSFPMLPMEKSVKLHIMFNSDGGFQVGRN